MFTCVYHYYYYYYYYYYYHYFDFPKIRVGWALTIKSQIAFTLVGLENRWT